MRFCVLLSAVCVLSSSVASAQWLETTIPFTEAHWPSHVAYSPASNRVYTGGDDDSTYVIDGATNLVVARLHVGEICEGFFYHPGADKLYRLNRFEQLDVIACPLDSVVKRIRLPASYTAGMCYNTAGDKLYCTSKHTSEVIVVDCSSDEVVKQIPVGDSPEILCYNPTRNKAYVSHSDASIAVVCGAGDTVLGNIYFSNRASALCYNSVNDKVYCAAERGNLLVISGTDDTVVASLPVPAYTLCYDAASNKVYAGGRQRVAIIDAAADTVLSSVPVYGTSLLYNPMNNKVYCATWSYGWIAVIDGVGDTLLKEIQVPDGSYGTMAWNPVHNRVYAPFGGTAGSGVAVLRDSLLGVEEVTTGETRTAIWPTIVRGVLMLPQSTSSKRHVTSQLLDITGRKLMDLAPGDNDVSHLAPGSISCIRRQAWNVLRRASPGSL
ncbi:MAG: YncE family protein [candidate division WOR-3 bacterium]